MLTDRFWSKVSKTKTCWIWKAKTNHGYGWFHFGKRPTSAHRLTFIEKYGAIPKNMVIDHICRNRACVNPEHLQLVTRAENVLLGIGFGAINKRKTQCPKGHVLDLIKKNGARGCRQCKCVIDKVRYSKNSFLINKKRREKYALAKAEGKVVRS